MASRASTPNQLGGLNWSPYQGLDGDAACNLVEFGGWLRYTARPVQDPLATLAEPRPIRVVDSDTVAKFGSFGEAAAWYAKHWSHAGRAVWQIGNEAAHTSPSSWTQTPAEYSALVLAWRKAFPRAYLLGCGGWDWEWLGKLSADARDALDGQALHPYGQWYSPDVPDDGPWFGFIGDLTALMQQTSSLPLWVTEYGAKSSEIGDAEQASYVQALDAWLKRAGLPRVCFCWSDAMVPGYGLSDDNQVLKVPWA